MGTANTVADQRRSRRYRQELPVDMIDKRGSRRGVALDVARHGLFVAIPDPPHNRHLVQLNLHLPDGPLQAAATVARVIQGKGVGLALFALSAEAKRRWDAFIHAAQLREQQAELGRGPATTGPPSSSSSASAPPSPSSPSSSSSAASSSASSLAPQAHLPSFLVRLKTIERLREYMTNHVAGGGTVLFTPVLPPAGSGVQLIVVHPRTYAEYPLYGQIQRSIAEQPKRLEILFVGVDLVAFGRFIDDGRAPSKPPTPVPVSTIPRPAEEPEQELEIDIDDDEGAMLEEPVEWDLRCEIGSAIADDDDDEVTARAPRPTMPQAVPSTTAGIAIVTDDAAIFGGDDDGEELLIDDTMAAADPGLRPTTYRLVCETAGCSSQPYTVEIGPCSGVLGLIADQVPFWSPDSERVVSVPRLLPADVRRGRFARYMEQGGGIGDVVNLATFLAAADLGESPRHPVTAEPLKSSRAVERLVTTARRAASGPAPTKVRCPCCNDGHLRVEAVAVTVSR